MTSLFDFQSENVKWVYFLDDHGRDCVTYVPLDRNTVVADDYLWDSTSRSKQFLSKQLSPEKIKKERQPFDLDGFLQMIRVDRDVYNSL